MSEKQRPYSLSVVMIVKNEAENLQVSLPAIADWVDEIIILDSGSTDESEEIAKQYGAKWYVNTDWPGFGKQKQLAQNYATGNWILALDADEEVSPELKDSILETIKHKPSDTVYGIRRIDYIFGHPIDNPKWVIPIKAHWRLYPNHFTYNDNMVHESVDIRTANTSVLNGYLRHHTGKTPAVWLKKRLDYAMAWANQRHQQGRVVNLFTITGHAVGAFFKQYFIDGRFLRGRYGFIYACLFSQYTFNKYAILYDLNHRPDSYRKDFQPHKITYRNLPDIKTFSTSSKEHKKNTLSAVIIVKNEQKHLPACLANIYEFCDEIIILDSGSTDKTEMIAKHFNAKWQVNTDWQGFGKQRQIAQQYATSDYVLVLDSDEQLNPSLKIAIKQRLNQPLTTESVFAIKRQNIFCGKAVHGNAWYYDQIVRLYANQSFSYHDYEVHESVNTKDAEVIVLDGHMLHFTNDNLYHFLDKNINYSDIWAKEKHKKNRRPAWLLTLPLRATVALIREYFMRGAFLGGAYGLFLSIAAANYNFNKYLMLSENHQNRAQ